MDPETEKRLAALIMEDAARLRMQADREGVHAYLLQPKARGRPNSQFLRATVRGIEQANRAAEISEMWKRRNMELDLEMKERDKGKHIHRNISSSSSSHSHHHRRRSSEEKLKTHHHWTHYEASSSPSRNSENVTPERVNRQFSVEEADARQCQDIDEDDAGESGLKDDEVETFLRSRIKRGRGTIGSRMDEPGPYPLPDTCHDASDTRVKDNQEERVIGPPKEISETKERKKRKLKPDKDEYYSYKKESSHERKEKKKKHKHKKKKKREVDSP